MSFIKWHPILYSVNITEFDEHHQKLVGLINVFHQNMMAGKGVDVLEKTFNELKDYTNYHFQAEERRMQAVSYPGYESHKTEHEKLIKSLDELSDRAAEGEKFVTIETFKFLKEWLFNHISKVDKALGDYLTGIKT